MLELLVIDNHAVVRHGVKNILDEHKIAANVGEAADSTEASQLLRSKDWNIVVMDIALPDKQGTHYFKEIKKEYPSLPVVIFSGYPEQQYAVRLIRCGAHGYLNKQCQPEEFVKAIRHAAEGKRHITNTVAELLAENLDLNNSPEIKYPHELLSDREYDIFLALASGHTQTEIARSSSLSIKTVSTYRSRINQKMGVKTNAELTLYAARHDLIN
jgi:DNA-binding NarL/FixJ family response regulator